MPEEEGRSVEVVFGDRVTLDFSGLRAPPASTLVNPDREKKAKLAYDEAIANSMSQMEALNAFRSRAQYFLTLATGAAAILSFSDEVQAGSGWSARTVSFWVGVGGFGLTALAVLLMYLPVQWRQNPGGAPERKGEVPRRWVSFFTGAFNRYPARAAIENHSLSRSRFIDQPDRPYAEMILEWNERHRFNHRVNEFTVGWMGRLSVLAIVGVAVLVIAWLYNGYGLSDPPPTRDRMQVELLEPGD